MNMVAEPVDNMVRVSVPLASYTVADVDETIRYWRVRGITANEAWRELGHRPNNASWARVRWCMIRWQLAYDAERTITKRAA